MEEVVSPLTEHGSGFEPIGLRQFTVFLENRVGRLHALVRQFEAEAARIVAISILDSADAALVRLICSEPDLGRSVLVENGFAFRESELIAVELPLKHDQPLNVICTALLAAEINIHYAYPLLQRVSRPAMALHVDDPHLAAHILMRKGLRLIGHSDLRDGAV